MLVLGMSGSFGLPGEEFIPNLPVWFFHDSAACIVKDGAVISAIEEERVNRIKHTNMMPVGAANACLEIAGITLEELDAVAYFFTEDYTNNELNLQYAENPDVPVRYSRELISRRLGHLTDSFIPPDKVVFVPHHQCHMSAAFIHSGFDSTLGAVFDGNGEEESISIFSVDTNSSQLVATYPPSHSLGHFYCLAIELLGYSRFDEYKVMGLAPYGDARKFRDTFNSLFDLKEGGYDLRVEEVRSCFLRKGFVPRRKGEAFRRHDADFAAGLQETLERIARHVVSHWLRATGHRNLCLSGGVAHNCTLNGRLAASGLFQKVFVHPAAHDAGAALGAALETCRRKSSLSAKCGTLKRVDWGSDLGTSEDQMRILGQWSDFFSYECVDDAPKRAAELLANGEIIGWAQGRMEFGPRALGNRSILADPRPYQNRDRINDAIKKRESYRPFAPAVLAEQAEEYFEVPEAIEDLGFMTFTIPVRPEKRALLAAVTHVDGSARVQSVSKTQNPRFWELIVEFSRLTSIPVVLNTSLNTAVEPIVRTVGDVLLCFLTTKLDALFIDNWLIRRKSPSIDSWLRVVLEWDPNVKLVAVKSHKGEEAFRLAIPFSRKRSRNVSEVAFSMLTKCNGRSALSEIIPQGISQEALAQIIDEFIGIINDRFLKISGLTC